MDVTWHIEPTPDGCRVDDRARLPAARRPGSPRSSTAAFTRPIAGRTLATFKALAEALGEADRRPDPPPRRTRRHERPAARLDHRASGSITAIGTGRDAFRAGLRAGRSPVKRIDRFDPSPFRSQVAAQVDDFDPLAWMPPKTARQLDRFSQFGLVAGRLALDDAGLAPGVGGARRPASGSGSTSARRSAASPTPRSSTSATSSKGIRQVAPNLALAVFGGAAPANLGIALDVRGPILSTANSCASGAVALGEALGDLREGRVDAAIAGGCEIPLSPLAFGAFDIIRALSAGHNDDAGAAPPGRSMPARDGFVMGEGAALLVLEDAEAAERARRDPVRRAARATARPPTPTTWSSRGPTAARPRGPRRSRSTTPASTRRDRLRQRPRVVDADRRRRRGAGDRAGARRRGRRPCRSAGRRRSTATRSGASGAIEAAICALAIRDGWAPASVNLDEPGPGCRRRSCPGSCAPAAPATYRRVLSTSFGFGGLNAALVFGAPDGCDVSGQPGRAASGSAPRRGAGRRTPRRGCGDGRPDRPIEPRRRIHASAPRPTASDSAAADRHRDRDAERRGDRAHQQPADRGRAREDRRVDAHDPAAQAVRGPRAGSSCSRSRPSAIAPNPTPTISSIESG